MTMTWPFACAVQPLVVVTGYKHEKPTSNRCAINSHLLLGESRWYIPYIVSTNSHSHLFGVVCLWMQTCTDHWLDQGCNDIHLTWKPHSIRRVWRYQRAKSVRRQHNDQKTNDKQRFTKHYTKNQRLSNTNPTKNHGCSGRVSSSCFTSDTYLNHNHKLFY
jgi:hypothetical protein